MDLDPALMPTTRYEWERLMRRAHIVQSVKATGLILSSYADSDGTHIRVGVELMAESCNAGSATVKRHLAKLRETGFIWRTKQGDRHHGLVDEYMLCVAHSFLSEVSRTGPRGKVQVSVVIPRRNRKPTDLDESGDHLDMSGDHQTHCLGIIGDPPPDHYQPTTRPKPHLEDVTNERATDVAPTDLLPRPPHSDGYLAAVAILADRRAAKA